MFELAGCFRALLAAGVVEACLILHEPVVDQFLGVPLVARRQTVTNSITKHQARVGRCPLAR